MINWKETALSEVSEKIAMGPFGSNIKIETFVGDGVPVISGQHLKGTRLVDKDYNFVTEEHANRLKNSLVYRGDVIFTHAGNIGQVAYIPENSKYERYIISQRQFFLRCNKEKLDSKFITYFFKSRYGQYKLLANANQVGVPSIAQPSSYLKSLVVNLPPIEEQKEISRVLSSFDDKVELLREENKALEATAQTIFREWFVNFNFPNTEGKSYKSSGGKMIDSELGEIPEGWRAGKLGDVLSLEYGKPMKEEDRTGTGYPVYGSNGVIGYHKDFLVKGDGIVVGRKGTMGSVIWAEDDFYPIDTAFYVQDKIGINKLFYHYLLLQSQDLERVGSDSAVPGLNRNSAYAIDFVIPSIDLVDEFHCSVRPIFSKIKNNNSQIKTISTLRDTLLPKLMSGEMRAENAKLD